QASLTAMLESARAATTAVSSRAAEHESALAEARGRSAALEAELAAVRKSLTEREQELATVRGEMQEWAGALQAAQLERNAQLASAGANDQRVRHLEERVAEQAEKLQALHSATDAAVARARELESDLHAAEESIARLESQLRGRNVRVAELENANQQWRLTLEEARAGHGADGQGRGETAPRGAAEEGSTRLLIHSDGGREIVHVLGRKTTIGRTPDNDLRIDARHISRHHAVILSTPAHTIIEDLNSTNGVVVNGRRITRQFLNDGDRVVVGRTHYRFAVRRGGDRR
ncbi:MAG TPA: FHA domain-containing protein, partial [Steroidobacteraceae bacterium]|nr:FHA domain-containing protein [Steroidobacteraceae bacterium]